MQGIVTDEVSAVNEALAEKIGPQKFRIWFKNSTRLSLTEGYVKVGVPNLFIASWIENHFTNEINDVVRQVTGTNRKVTFAIDPELTGHQRRTQLDSQAQLVEKTRNRTQRQRATKKPKTGKKLKLSFDTFIVGSSNQLAYNAAKAVADEEKSPFNPLFVHGGYGVGKTHLLQGISPISLCWP